jgi:NCAIR mutase (PurE)-related protein
MSNRAKLGEPSGIEVILDRLVHGEMDRAEAIRALEQIGKGPIEDLGYARIDHDRAHRRGFPEVIYGPGKSREQVVEIFGRLRERNPNVLATRVAEQAGEAVSAAFEDAVHDAASGLVYCWRDRSLRGIGTILVVTAGTSDQQVAREAATCAEVMGNQVDRIDDVGVAGIDRLLQQRARLREARVVICVAGMEAALPSVVGGMTDRPVIALPTSVGYGATFGGMTALLASLTACSSGITTVNIDNGFGAAYAASLINRP